MSNLEDHARAELQRIGEEPETIDWYCRVITEFASFGHSGGSAAATIPVLHALLQFQPLGPLTDDPGEWTDVAESMWQSTRNPEAFSDDAGRTYWLLSEGAHSGQRSPRHAAAGRGQ